MKTGLLTLATLALLAFTCGARAAEDSEGPFQLQPDPGGVITTVNDPVIRANRNLRTCLMEAKLDAADHGTKWASVAAERCAKQRAIYGKAVSLSAIYTTRMTADLARKYPATPAGIAELRTDVAMGRRLSAAK